MIDKLDVLDRGYVVLHDVMGSDLTVVNAARVSYDRKSENLSKNDIRLINFLAREGHTSPFRHATMQLEIYAPLMVARQHWKYIVGSSIAEADGDNMDAWNESSRRYVTEEPTFYIPGSHQWRSSPENSKQGSGKPLGVDVGVELTEDLIKYVDSGLYLYEEAMKNGACAEQARLFLPAYGMYVRYYWTASLQSVAHFIKQRLADDSQVEIQEYAKAVHDMTLDHFPESVIALMNNY